MPCKQHYIKLSIRKPESQIAFNMVLGYAEISSCYFLNLVRQVIPGSELFWTKSAKRILYWKDFINNKKYQTQ